MRRPFVQLAKDTFFYSAALMVRRGLGIVTLPIFTRFLSVSEFGTIAVLGTVRGLQSVVFELGIPNSSARLYYDCRTDADRRRLFGTLFIAIAGISFAGTLILLWTGPLLWRAIAPEIPFHPYVTLSVVTVCLAGMDILPRTLFRVTNRVPLYTTLGVLQGVLASALAVTLVVLGFGVLGSVLAGLVAVLVFVPVFFHYLRGHLAWEFSPRLLGESLSFGLPEIPVRIATWALRLADRLILQRYLTLAAVGLYSVGYSLGGAPFDLIASSVNSAILPFIYQTARDEHEDSTKRVFADLSSWTSALLAFLGLLTILFSREAILLLTVPAYLEAEPVVALIVWASIFQALAQVPTRAIYLAKKTAHLPLVFTVPAMINVGLNFVLIPRYGLMGAAWATLLAYPVLFGLTLWVAQRVYPIPYDYGRMVKPLILTLGLSLFKDAIPSEPLVSAICLKGLLLGAFPVGLIIFGFVTAGERRLLRQLTFRVVGSHRAVPETTDRL